MKKFTIILFFLLLPIITFAQLVSVGSFGSNPGNLNMYRYSPVGISSNAPLVVVLHGCTQNASTFANETEWNKLANTYGFHVIYPEQKSANNSSQCFNWFENGDISRGQGEALSIKQMIDFMKNNFSIDDARVFVTGLSAGGAMTTVMCAAYPEVFAAGAPMAGVPYRAGVGTTAAFQAMSPGIDRTPQQWGDLVRQQFPSFSGTYPKMVIFHGSQDFTVRPMNMVEIAEQWTNVNGADATIDITNTNFDGVNNITRRVYNNNSGNAVVITYEMIGMGHAITVNPGNSNPKQGGQTGGYSVNRGFWSSYWAADFFGLLAPASPPAAPSILSATTISDVQIDLTWVDNSDNEDNFALERATSENGTYAVIATLNSNTTTYSDNGLTANTTYYYRVRAANGAGNSAYSNIANTTTNPPDLTTPNSPSNLVATVATSTQIDLTWTDNSGNELSFELERSTSPTTGFEVVATLAANTNSYSDTNLSNNTSYFYRLKASNNNGSSAYSNTATATTPNLVITNDTISQPNGNFYITTLNTDNTGQSFTLERAGILVSVSVRLNSAISNSNLRIFVGNTVSGTPIYSQSGVGAGSGWQTISLANSLELNANTQYTFQLTNASIAYTSSNVYTGGNFWYNAHSYTFFDAAFELIIQSVEEGSTPPNSINAPSNLTAASISDTQINLSWTDNSTNEDNFVIERSTLATTGFSTIATLAANTTTYSNTGLSENTSYYYRVKATNSNTNSAYSNTASAATQQNPNPPAAPSNLTATASSTSQINLTWTDNSINEDSFVIERANSANTGFTLIATLAANSVSYTDSGLNENTTYYYRIKANNNSGSSVYSNTSNATTQQTQASTYTIAQTTGSFYLSTLNNVNTGQSITTNGAGQIMQVKFKLFSAISNSTLRVYEGNTVSGTPVYSQNVSTNAGNWQTFTLTTPFEVNANTQYTIILTNASVAYRALNVYSGGHLWYNSIAYTGFDAAFEVLIEEDQNKNALPIATSKEVIEFKIYPNPCTEWISIDYDATSQVFDFGIYSATGQKLIENTVLKPKSKIEVGHLPKGLYYLLIEHEGKKYTKQFIIN